MRAQPQPQTQSSITESDSMKRQKTEDLKKKLKGDGIPEENWSYYLRSPHTWNYSVMSTSGLCKGVEVVLLTPTPCIPIWFDKNSISQFKQLRSKLKAVLNMKGEIEEFKENEDPDDNYFIFSLKQASKIADNLQQELQMACDALEDVCIDDSNDFGNDFLDSLIKFSRAAASNKDAHKKVKDLQTLSVERGIVMQQTNISPEQNKALLPFFNGALSLSVLDALDRY